MEPKLDSKPDLSTCSPLSDFKPMPKMDTSKPLNGLVYCDYLATLIKNLLRQMGIKSGKIEIDLDPTDGHLVSHKKVLECEYMGRTYKITVEDV
jgi:hypothetical protein